MDMASALVALISIAAFTIPFIYLSRVQSNKKKQILNFIKSKASEHGLNLDEMDYWNQQYAIGLDQKKNALIYLKKSNENWNENVINLSEFQKCSIQDSNRKNAGSLSNGNGAANLHLVLSPAKANLPEKNLEFFDRSESLTLNGEWKLLEKWKSIVTDKISA
jgi:hypothetical protein